MKQNDLSRRERQIMDALHELGDEASAEDIRQKLPNPPGYSAVRAMLAKLEAKGAIRHKEEGLRYVYSPTARRSAARRSAVERLVRVFFGGSPGEAVNALLEAEKWDPRELDEMSKRIEQMKKERGTMSAREMLETLVAASADPVAALVLKATLAMAASLLLIRSAHGAPASLRHLVAAAGFGVLLLLPLAALVVPEREIAVAPRPGGRGFARGRAAATTADVRAGLDR